MNERGRIFSKEYKRIQSEITNLLNFTEPSSADLAVLDRSDFHIGDVLAYSENVTDVSSAHQLKTLPLNIKLAAKHNIFHESLNDLL